MSDLVCSDDNDEKHDVEIEAVQLCICNPEVLFIGHVAGKTGLSFDSAKVHVAAGWQVPGHVKELRLVFVPAKCVRKAVQDCSCLFALLTRLTRVWASSELLSVNRLLTAKHALVHAPVLVLAMPDF